MPYGVVLHRNIPFFSYVEVGIVIRVFEGVAHQKPIVCMSICLGHEKGVILLKASRMEFRLASKDTKSRPEALQALVSW